MASFKKHYIGKGTQVPNLNIIKFTLNMATLSQFAHSYNGQFYISFEVAQLQAPDQFGHTHTVYISHMLQAHPTE